MGARSAFILIAAAIASPAIGADPIISVSPQEYPAEALQHRQKGNVRVAFDVAETGRVQNCRVIQSSGHPLLDAKSCRILEERGAFAPKRDKGGRPKGNSARFVLEWGRTENSQFEIPGYGGASPIGAATWVKFNDLSHPDGFTVFDLDVDDKGVARKCVTAVSSGSKSFDDAVCRLILSRAKFLPASDGRGGARASKWRSSVRVQTF